MSENFSIEAFSDARGRIANRVRRTPLFEAKFPKSPVADDHRLFLKLENLQPTGSFKVRGASNALGTLTKEEVDKGLLTASGGNHGLAVAYAAWSVGAPAVIYLPENTPASKVEKLRKWGAEVVIEGPVWDDANAAALEREKADGLTYIHPFADPRVIHGQGTVSLEILEDEPEIDVLLVAIGGGGLSAGAATAAKLANPKIRVIGIEPIGAPTLHDSVKAGKVVQLEKIETAANTLAPRMTEQMNFDLIRKNVDEIVLVSDDDMISAAKALWFEYGIAAELSGAAAYAALSTGKVALNPGESVCAIVCGAGTDGLN